MFSFLKTKEKILEEPCLKAVCNGKSDQMSNSTDPVFASCVLGDGVLFHPDDGTVVSPCSGEVTLLADTKHAVGIRTSLGVDIMVHIGVDTVTMNGEGFQRKVKQGMKVKTGTPLVTFDKQLVESRGLCSDIMLIVMEGLKAKEVRLITGVDVRAGESIVATFCNE